MTQQQRINEAQSYHQFGLRKVATTKAPEGQKFPIGSRVRIAKDLGDGMSHFPSDKLATVRHTYAHAFGGNHVKSYCLDVDGEGEISWYEEHQLTLERNKSLHISIFRYIQIMKINPDIQKFLDVAESKADDIYCVGSPNPTHNEELLREAIVALREALQLVRAELISIDTRPQM